MRAFILLAVTLGMAGGAKAGEVTASSRVDAVTVFSAGAEVVRIARVTLDKGEHVITFTDLSAQTVPGSIRVEGKATGKLEIGSVDQRRLFVTSSDGTLAEGERKRLEDEILQLKDQRSLVEGQIEATETQKALIANLAQLPGHRPPPAGSPPGQPSQEDWTQILGLIGRGMADVHHTALDARVRLRELDGKIEDLEKRLAALAPAREERTEVKVYVSAASPLEADLALRYQVPAASWTPLYDARLTTGAKTVEPRLELTRRAAISQRTGESWDNVALQLSTARPAAGASAPDMIPMTVDFAPEARTKASATPPAPAVLERPVADTAERAVGEGAAVAEAQPAQAKEDVSAATATSAAAPFQALFNVPGRVTVPASGVVKRVELGKDSLDTVLTVRTAPKQEAKAYLYAHLVVPKSVPLLPGQVSLFRDGTFVGTGKLPLLVSGADYELGFGADDLMRVRHAIIEEKRGETGLISSTRTDTRNYKITIKNLHERTVQLVVMDQIPVSQNQEIKVELTGRTPPTRKDIDDSRGVLAWEAKLEADEERAIEFGYRVSWPANKLIVYRPIVYGR